MRRLACSAALQPLQRQVASLEEGPLRKQTLAGTMQHRSCAETGRSAPLGVQLTPSRRNLRSPGIAHRSPVTSNMPLSPQSGPIFGGVPPALPFPITSSKLWRLLALLLTGAPRAPVAAQASPPDSTTALLTRGISQELAN